MWDEKGKQIIANGNGTLLLNTIAELLKLKAPIKKVT
jgi:hypothetical protein